ncbi:hypothetical protein [Effusibacillus consociatus]|uniref:Uncharacterized protein n=1 Tax=Effusibacillus consociatus TaxID=1117041 RepID=A0ABV9Q3P7_9BACL
MKRFGILILILTTLLFGQSTVTANPGQAAAIHQWKNRIADSNPIFHDWKDSTVRQLFAESTAYGQEAVVWQVENQNRNLGYFVTASNGQALFEYSPVTPIEMLKNQKAGHYLYIGPGMHLFQVADADPDTWMNLANGETIQGKPIRQRASIIGEAHDSEAGGENFKGIQFSTDTRSDYGIDVMIQYGFGHSVPFDKKLLPETGEAAGYLVFTTLAKDYYSVWAITGLQTIRGNLEVLELRDVFAGAEYPIYIGTDPAVNWVGSR